MIQVMSVVNEPIHLGYESNWAVAEDLLRSEEELANRAVAEAETLLKREGVVVTTALHRGTPAREILRVAEEFSADLVVVGSKGLSGLEGFLMGSVARAVAKRCECPVLVARAPGNELREVIVATDGSEHASHALRRAATLPLPDTAHRTLVHVVRPYKPVPDFLYMDAAEHEAAGAEVHRKQREIGAAVLEEAQEELNRLGKAASTELRVGEPATEILRLAGELNADLIIAGARGVSFIEGLLMGSVAERLLKEARCSVLIVH
jgi:nucleotide-binding universal stress UspA family protein